MKRLSVNVECTDVSINLVRVAHKAWPQVCDKKPLELLGYKPQDIPDSLEKYSAQMYAEHMRVIQSFIELMKIISIQKSDEMPNTVTITLEAEVPVMLEDTCAYCGKDLKKCDEIWAAEGYLFCSRECGIKNLQATFVSKAEQYFDDIAEVITPQDIGIVPDSDVQEPSYYGDLCRCDWCGKMHEESELVKTDLGMLCDTCIRAIRSRGEEVKIIER